MNLGHEPAQSAVRDVRALRMGPPGVAVDAGAPPEDTPRAVPAGAFLFVQQTL